VGCDVLREKLGVGAKPATPCEDKQHRKINCSLLNALVEKAAEKFAWWAAGWHAGLVLKAAPQLRKINCTLRNAVVEKLLKICMVGCDVLRRLCT